MREQDEQGADPFNANEQEADFGKAGVNEVNGVNGVVTQRFLPLNLLL